jgi:hypothetical protein
MSAVPADTQVLHALADVIAAAPVDALLPVHIGRGDDDPFDASELPAINLLIVNTGISTRSRQGAAVGVRVLEENQVQIVVQVVTRATADAEDLARVISAQAQQAVALNPTLGGVCRDTIYPVARQWLRDDNGASPMARQNTLYQGDYRTWSDNPFVLA